MTPSPTEAEMRHHAPTLLLRNYRKKYVQAPPRKDVDVNDFSNGSIHGRVVALSFDAVGCRLVQTAFEELPREEAIRAAHELSNHVLEAIESPHANYVLAKILQVLPNSRISFIAASVQKNVLAVARHKYGCRILCRIIENFNPAFKCVDTQVVLDEIMANRAGLVRHEYGHHVLVAALQHGSEEQVETIIETVSAKLANNAKHRHATYLTECALNVLKDEKHDKFADELVQCGKIAEIASNQGGRHVVRSLVRSSPERRIAILAELQKSLDKLIATKAGRNIAIELGLISK